MYIQIGSSGFSSPFRRIFKNDIWDLCVCARTICQQYLKNDLAQNLKCEMWKQLARLAASLNFLCVPLVCLVSFFLFLFWMPSNFEMFLLVVGPCSRHNILLSGENAIVLKYQTSKNNGAILLFSFNRIRAFGKLIWLLLFS